MLARNHFMTAIAQEARAAHARFTGGSERFDVTYEPNVAFEAPTADAVAAALTARFRAVADSERARRSAVAGPHRDDLKFTLDGHSLEAYGSQGQQRTAVLALKVAEYAVMRERAGESPLLLLDDVLSELDEERAAAFLGRRRRLRASLRHGNPSAGRASGANANLRRARSAGRDGRRMLRLSDAIAGWAPGSGRAHEDPMLLLGAVWPELVGEDVARNSHPAAAARGHPVDRDPVERVEPGAELSGRADRRRRRRAAARMRGSSASASASGSCPLRSPQGAHGRPRRAPAPEMHRRPPQRLRKRSGACGRASPGASGQKRPPGGTLVMDAEPSLRLTARRSASPASTRERRREPRRRPGCFSKRHGSGTGGPQRWSTVCRRKSTVRSGAGCSRAGGGFWSGPGSRSASLEMDSSARLRARTLS